MTKSQKFILVAATSLALLLPSAALAQTNSGKTPAPKPPTNSATNTTTGSSSSSPVTNDTCGELQQKFDSAGGTNVIAGVPKYCDYNTVYQKIIKWSLWAIAVVAVIAILYGGYLYMTAQANEAQKKKAKGVLTWAIIGLAVVILAATIVNVVLHGLVDNRFV